MKPVTALLFSLAASVALGQATLETAGQSSAASKPKMEAVASKDADLRRLLVVTRYEENFRVVFARLFEQLKVEFPNISESQWREFEAELKLEELIGIAIRIYDKHFTHEEIKQLLEFYESPLGRKTVRELPDITQEVLREGEEWGKRIATRIETKEQKGRRTRATATVQPSISTSGETNRQRLRKPVSAMTQEEKDQSLRESGYDPAYWKLEEPEAPKIDSSLPKANYRIKVGNDWYYSAKEPKRDGASYKVQDIRGFEVTVSGNVQIIQIPKQ